MARVKIADVYPLIVGDRGGDAGCPAPPAQIRTCPIWAYVFNTGPKLPRFYMTHSKPLRILVQPLFSDCAVGSTNLRAKVHIFIDANAVDASSWDDGGGAGGAFDDWSWNFSVLFCTVKGRRKVRSKSTHLGTTLYV